MADTSKDELLLDGGITASQLHRAEVIIIIIIITDLYSAFRSEDTEALGAAQED